MSTRRAYGLKTVSKFGTWFLNAELMLDSGELNYILDLISERASNDALSEDELRLFNYLYAAYESIKILESAKQ